MSFLSWLDDMKSHVSSKLANPFLGTYAGVWIIRHWWFLYSLFTFEEGLNLDYRITHLRTYFGGGYSFWSDLGANILWTIGVLILTYLLLNFTRIISVLSEEHLKAWLYQLTRSKKLATFEQVDRLEKQVESDQQRISVLKSQNQSLQSELESATKEIDELYDNLTRERQIKESLEGKVSDITALLEGDSEALNPERKRLRIKQLDDLTRPDPRLELFQPMSKTTNEIIKDFEDPKLRKLFFAAVQKIENRSLFDTNDEERYRRLKLIGLIDVDVPSDGGAYFKLTSQGEEIKRKYEFYDRLD